MRWHRQADVDRESAERARARLQVLDALAKAVDRREEFFRIVSVADDQDVAVGAVMVAFDVDAGSAEAMLGMPARQFTARARKRIDDERAALTAQVSTAS